MCTGGSLPYCVTVAPQPALALLEFDSIAAGILAADAMIKAAPIARIKPGTVHPGHYLVLVGGSVASVEEAYRAGLSRGDQRVIDHVLLPDVHVEVYSAALGARRRLDCEALGVFETKTVASLLQAADAGVKGAHVHIAEIRLADDLGGHAFVLYDGVIADVEAALEISERRIRRELIHGCVRLPRLDETLSSALTETTRFAPLEALQPDGAEIDVAG
jgi:microcompartment protein CcmL/EutN